MGLTPFFKHKLFLLPWLLVLHFNGAFGQSKQLVDFQKIKASITLLPQQQAVRGDMKVRFKVLHTCDSVFLDAQNMQLVDKPKNTAIKLSQTAHKIWFVSSFEKGKIYTIDFSYTTSPKQSLYFVGWGNAGSNQIWTQGQGRKTSYWLPSIDDYNEKIEFDLKIAAPTDYRVIANGRLMRVSEVIKNNHDQRLWEFDMTHPMSSYLVALAVGRYKKKDLTSTSGVSIKLFYEAEDSLKVEPTYRYSKLIFDFLEAEIGVPFPWKTYKQVPVRDFLYAGMENTTLTIFSDDFMVDSIGFVDQNYIKVNAHELAHQWFGDFVTQASGKHHWLQEGFATYYALLAERKIFGNDYYYYQLYSTAQKLYERSKINKGQSLLNPKANSLTFYQKGAWALHILHEKIGDKAFREGVKNYLLKNAYATGTTTEFIAAVEKSSKTDLSAFVNTWLKQKSFPKKQAFSALRKSKFMRQYLALVAMEKQMLSHKKKQFMNILTLPVNHYLASEVVRQLAKNSVTEEEVSLVKLAFASGNLKTRQAIAKHVIDIPLSLETEYASLLGDASYITKESALYHLWGNFPNKRSVYLEKMTEVEGLSNKNVEMLWLALALATPNYKPEDKRNFYQRLSGYTAATYSVGIRQNAFRYLKALNVFSQQNYADLLAGCFHFVSNFRNFSRVLLESLIQDESARKKLEKIIPELPKKQAQFLTQKLK